MQSDILEALAAPWQTFRSALATTAEQVRGSLHEEPHGDDDGSDLGAFASGRIDLQRFTDLVARDEATDDEAESALREAYDTLSSLVARDTDLVSVDVAPGASLHEAVYGALAGVGRAFGAARAVDLARSGRFRRAEHGGLVDWFPFPQWSRAERRLAPPLVVSVDGADLQAGALAEFLDGALKIVLVTRGATPPAALVRLVSPGVFVLQTTDASDLARFAASKGAGVAAVVPEGAACFTHDPAAGEELWDRMSVQRLPERAPRVAVGGHSAQQMAEELAQLRALSHKPEIPEAAAVAVAAEPAAGSSAAPAADPAAKLAAWLLKNAEL